MTTHFPGVIYVMGVSGCGKSTIAREISLKLDIPFCEADKLHPDTNIERMSAGIPLTDADREPWLQSVAQQALTLATRHDGCVVACSALKQRYRDTLSTAHTTVYYVYLHGDYDTILSRMSERTGHFMPDSLLKSQFKALEEPTPAPNVIYINIDHEPAQIVAEAVKQLEQRNASQAAN